MNGHQESSDAAETYDKFSHPFDVLKHLSSKWNLGVFSEEFAKTLDECGIWSSFRNEFHYPKFKDLPSSVVDPNCIKDMNEDSIYLCGNSLGLQPKKSRELILKEMDKWANFGVFGHTMGDLPWASCEDPCRTVMAKLVGANIDEINVMNFLTVNIHIMMISFYQPTEKRFKILLEEHAFPSDHYIVESQIKLHNLDPKDCMICLKPREGEACLRTEDILKAIEEHGDEIALVFFSGVQYYTGQYFQIKEITDAAHKKGCMVGWDLAHAVGNVELHLHDWGVDFAAWCSYKYLNSGAGCISAIFLHEKHFDVQNRKKLDGWWGHRMETRFKMANHMEYAHGAASYSLSNAPMLLTSCLLGSLEVFDKAGIKSLRQKSKVLTGYLELLLNEAFKKENEETNKICFDLLTPKDPEQRGAQLSLRFSVNVVETFKRLEKHGVVCDYREPNVLRFAPAPLYNTFYDVYRFVRILEKIMKGN